MYKKISYLDPRLALPYLDRAIGDSLDTETIDLEILGTPK